MIKSEYKDSTYPVHSCWGTMKDLGAAKSTCKRLIKTALDLNFQQATNILVVGMPNTGKSTLINSIRKSIQGPNLTLKKNASQSKSGAKTGALPGVTRTVSGFRVWDSPASYLLDTPGIMVPKAQMDLEQGLKLALTGCIKDSVVGEDMISEYLLYCISLNANTSKLFEGLFAIDPQLFAEEQIDYQKIMEQVAAKMGARKSPKEWDFTRVSKHLIMKYRKGDFGPQTLDSINNAHQQLLAKSNEKSDFDKDKLSEDELLRQRLGALEEFRKSPHKEDQKKKPQFNLPVFKEEPPNSFWIEH